MTLLMFIMKEMCLHSIVREDVIHHHDFVGVGMYQKFVLRRKMPNTVQQM